MIIIIIVIINRQKLAEADKTSKQKGFKWCGALAVITMLSIRTWVLVPPMTNGVFLL